MILDALAWSIPAGIIHFIALGILYGNPYIDKYYAEAQLNNPAVRRWDSKSKYLLTQFLGTQIEVIIIVFAYLFFSQFLPTRGIETALVIGGIFAAIRVYPRFWNMWIQSTYPIHLLRINRNSKRDYWYIANNSVY